MMIRKLVIPLFLAFMLMSCGLLSPGDGSKAAVETAKAELAPTVEARIATSVAATVGAASPSGAGNPSGVVFNITEPFRASLTRLNEPMSGELERTDADFEAEQCVGVNIADFVMEATLTNPGDIDAEDLSYGVFFRQEDKNEQLRLILHDGNWYLFKNGSDYLDTGIADTYKDRGMDNLIQLYVRGVNAYLYLNGERQAQIEIGQYSMASGDVCLVGWYYDDSPLYHSLPFKDFTVWGIQ